MIKIKTGQKALLKWKIMKAQCYEAEDFSRVTDMCVFLVGGRNKYPFVKAEGDEAGAMEYNIENGTIVATIPEYLSEGVYGVEAFWIKDMLCKRAYTKVSNVFAITDEERVHSGLPKIFIESRVATYGYDGLDAYELAVLHGMTTMTREEWLNSIFGGSGSIGLATFTKDGLMPKEMFAKLYNIDIVTAFKAGLMSSGDKVKLDELVTALNALTQRVNELEKGSGQNPITPPTPEADYIIYGDWEIGELGGITPTIGAGGDVYVLSAQASRTRQQHYTDGSTTDMEAETVDVSEFELVDGDALLNRKKLTVEQSVNGQVIVIRAKHEGAKRDYVITQEASSGSDTPDVKPDLPDDPWGDDPETVPVGSIVIGGAPDKLYHPSGVKGSAVLTATVLPSDATEKGVTWSSDDTGIVSVYADGVVTAVGTGSTTIRCSAVDGSGVVATCVIVVEENVVVSHIDKDHRIEELAVTGLSGNVPAEGGTYGLTAQGVTPVYDVYADGTERYAHTNEVSANEISYEITSGAGYASIDGRSVVVSSNDGAERTIKIRAKFTTNAGVVVTSDELTLVQDRMSVYAYYGSSSAAPTSVDTANRVELTGGSVQIPISAATSDKKRSLWVAVPKSAGWRVASIVDLDNDGVDFETVEIGDFRVYHATSLGYISNTYRFNLTK